LYESAITVNAELQGHIAELTIANDDVKNLLDSTEIATVFLNINLGIRRFTPKFSTIIPLTASDTDRPIEHFSTRLIDVDIAQYASKVLSDLKIIEQEVSSSDGKVYTMRIRPYRTNANVIDGVVVTFEDITLRMQIQNRLEESELKYRSLFELANDSLVLIDAQTNTIVEFNTIANERLGYTQDEFKQLRLGDIDTGKSSTEIERLIKKLPVRENSIFESKHRHKNGKTLDVQVKIQPITLHDKPHLLSTWRYP